MQFEFTKWHGAGNDFVIVNGFQHTIEDYGKAAIKICDRHFGIGADGLVFVQPSDNADFKMRIFNPDGSEAEMCGNVTRCVARYVYETQMTQKTKFSIETKAGIIRPELILEEDAVVRIKVNMGRPVLAGDQIPVNGFDREEIISRPLSVQGVCYEMTCVSMGNPHCVIFVDDVETVELEKIGPLIEMHDLFPNKVNVEFAEIKDGAQIRMRVWERGAGVTMACGTGSCATLVAAVLNGKTKKAASLVLDGGTLWIEWAEDGCVYMSGPAQRVFSGSYYLE